MDTIITRYNIQKEILNARLVNLRNSNVVNDINVSKRNLIDSMNVFSKVGLLTFAIFGTLLGIIREKRLLPHDQDVDLGFMDTDLNKVIDAHEMMEAIGFELFRNYEDNSVISYVREGHVLDLFMFNSENQVPCRIKQAKKFPRNSILPTTLIEFENNLVCIPNNSKNILRSIYGPMWRIRLEGYNHPQNYVRYFVRIILKRLNIYDTRILKKIRMIFTESGESY